MQEKDVVLREPGLMAAEKLERAHADADAALRDVIVVGAGQAGLSLSHFLRRNGVSHVVLERDRPFSSWHHRWDGFHANTPNWMNSLPRDVQGLHPGRHRGDFATKQELLEYFGQYLDELKPPLRTGCQVTGVRQGGDGHWDVTTESGTLRARNVAVCTGAMCAPRIPPVAADIPAGVPQMHSSEYRNPGQLRTPEVLIVGSGSSGVQICKELCRSARFRRIHLATSNILVLPRHVCGIQIHRFLHLFGFFQVRTQSMLGRLTGRGPEGRLPSSLAAVLAAVQRGAHIVRVHDVAATVDVLAVWRRSGLLA